MIFFGIDPGKLGSATAIYDDGRPWEGACCPLDGTDLDIIDWFLQFDLTDARATVERVSSSPQMGVVSAFTFGRGVGFLHGILSAHRIPMDLVTPAKWQRALNCLTKGDKNISKAAAQRMWPTMKITHRNADSLLIAEYGRREWARFNLSVLRQDAGAQRCRSG